MTLRFTKMHGLGNDFVVIDATREPFAPDAALLRQLTDRHRGVGCDQVLVIDPPPDADVDFGYRIYNADGSQVGQCGNGARCLARYVREHGLSDKPELRVATRSARMRMQLLDDGLVRVDMGEPQFAPSQIPLAVDHQQSTYQTEIPGFEMVNFGAVSMGNPHAVIRVDDVDRAPVEAMGIALQKSPLFPQSVNVGFLEIVARDQLKLRVFERGAGETQACGSGACAAFSVARMWGLVDDEARMALRGGTLTVCWRGAGYPLWMTGAAETVYEGHLP